MTHLNYKSVYGERRDPYEGRRETYGESKSAYGAKRKGPQERTPFRELSVPLARCYGAG